MRSEDRFKMLRGVWQIFTLLSVMLIVFGSGWGTVAVLLGLALMTLLATFMLLRVGPVIETADVYPPEIKAKRSDARIGSLCVDAVDETDSDKSSAGADGPMMGDDGELLALRVPGVR